MEESSANRGVLIHEIKLIKNILIMETIEKIIDLVTEKKTHREANSESSDEDTSQFAKLEDIDADIDDLYKKLRLITKRVSNIEDRLTDYEDVDSYKQKKRK
jgi:hypothetical protein